MSPMQLWRWPVQVYTEAETQEEAERLLNDALTDEFGEDGWTTDQPAVSEGPESA